MVFEPALEVSEWPVPEPVPSVEDYRNSVHWAEHAPILIDNGSSELRAGFATHPGDRPLLAFDNVASRFRDRKRNTNVVLCGRDCYVDSQGRAAMKSPFDGDVVCGFDTMETILDYTFTKLGIDTDRVEHPLLLTETLCNPEYTRSQMNEIVFEAYNAPSVNYGMDALFSAYANDVRGDGLVVSAGRTSTLVVPLVGGGGVLDNAKRLAWGGALGSEFLLKLLQLKYPSLPQKLTSFESQTMMESLCYVSPDYDVEIRSLSKPENLAAIDKVVQLPYVTPEHKEKTAEELELIAERKRAASQRLIEQTRVMREEKALQNENDLKYYTLLQENKALEPHDAYLQRLQDEGFGTEQELHKTVKKLDAAVKRSRGEEDDEEKKPPETTLVDIPDAELDEEGVKEKRRQRLLKAGYDARIRARAEKAEQERVQLEKEQQDRDEQRDHPETWLAKVRTQHHDALARIQEQRKAREMMPDRKSAAAQQRMKSITALASEQNTSGGGRRRKRNEDEDTFGADDSDWSVYRTVTDATSEEEERGMMAQLDELETKLLEHDPSFTEEDTYAALLARKTRLTNTFLRGFEPRWDPNDTAQYHQVHLNVERIRVPEISWQPYIAGVDQAGVAELSRHVLMAFDEPVRARMAKNVLATGRYTQLPGFATRLHTGLRTLLPTSVEVGVRAAHDARFDPWRGMRQWVLDQPEQFRSTSVSRADYEEKGSAWFQEHALSACWQA